LGPEICNNPVIKNSKITPEESIDLEAPLNIKELDDALKMSNKKSAPGIDVSMKLIEHCWKFFRMLLLNYANCCFQKGQLTLIFGSACINLIPKKGDTSCLKNWRPISLL
jgi:hypothetical protein